MTESVNGECQKQTATSLTVTVTTNIADNSNETTMKSWLEPYQTYLILQICHLHRLYFVNFASVCNLVKGIV